MKPKVERSMTCSQWMKLLGSTTEDAKFIATLQQIGITRVPRVDSANKTVNGVTLSFCHPDGLRAKIGTTRENTAVFFGMMVHLSDLKGENNYSGPLPFKLKSSDSLKDLMEKLGKPTSQNVKGARYQWKRDPFDLIAFFEKDLKTLKFISFVLPYA